MQRAWSRIREIPAGAEPSPTSTAPIRFLIQGDDRIRSPFNRACIVPDHSVLFSDHHVMQYEEAVEEKVIGSQHYMSVLYSASR